MIMLGVQVIEDLLAHLLGDDVERLFVHGTGMPLVLFGHLPGKGVERTFRLERVVLYPALDETDDGGLGAPHRPVEQRTSGWIQDASGPGSGRRWRPSHPPGYR